MSPWGKQAIGVVVFFALVSSVVAAYVEGYYAPRVQAIIGGAIQGAFVGGLIAPLILKLAVKLPRRALPPFLRYPTAEELFTRNQDIVAAYVAKVKAPGLGEDEYVDDSYSVYVGDEDLSRECLRIIAAKEGKLRLAPEVHEDLHDWVLRPEVTEEWWDLSKAISEAIDARRNAVTNQTIVRLCNELLEVNRDLVQRFFEIAERKVAVVDEYGEESWDSLPSEIATVVLKIAKRNRLKPDEKEFRTWVASEIDTTASGLTRNLDEINDWDDSGLPQHYYRLAHQLEIGFREYHKKHKARSASLTDVESLSGVEFETRGLQSS